MSSMQTIAIESSFVVQDIFGSPLVNVIPNMVAGMKTIIINRCNVMIETIGNFSITRNEVKPPRYVLTVALGHTFGFFHAERRESTILG